MTSLSQQHREYMQSISLSEEKQSAAYYSHL
ncbi:hypothetical protein NC651_038706 [Populus alba x Populus x berolinensis]|nr:hypothetical protein NC651_038706 [Populus alba x Populus x berolinensis]